MCTIIIRLAIYTIMDVWFSTVSDKVVPVHQPVRVH